MTKAKHTVVGLGELLWDLLPSGKQLGGAPANFAYITSLLGDIGIPASRTGLDALGDEAHQRLTPLGVPPNFVQRDANHPTGTVKVEIENGQPRFEILQPVAWDFLEWTDPWRQLAADAHAVCYGSLAQRSPQSRTTIRSFLHATRPDALRVFDCNLRQNFYSRKVVADSLRLATIAKLNHEELPIILRLLESKQGRGMQESARDLLSSFDLSLVCITRGNAGSLLVSATECCEHPGFQVKVADTVGAGDAFTAALVHAYLRGASLAEINERANRLGAWVASQHGGMPAPDSHGFERIRAEIG
jgi:fructokinase